MRPIRLAHLEKTRPVLVLTREVALGVLTNVTIAPITSHVRGLATEVEVGPDNGLDQRGAVSCDNIVTVPASTLGRHLGFLLPSQEPQLSDAIAAAFDLD